MTLRKYPGDLLLLGLFLLPVVVVAPALPWGSQGWLYSLAELAGVFALSAFLLAGMLSARIPGTDPWFGGLVRLWTIHRWLGFSAFMLVMAHVLLLALAILPASAVCAGTGVGVGAYPDAFSYSLGLVVALGPGFGGHRLA